MAPAASTTDVWQCRAAHGALVVRLVHVTPAAERARHLKPIAPNATAHARPPGARRAELLYRTSPPCHHSAHTAPRRAHTVVPQTHSTPTHARRCFAEGTAKPHKVPRTHTNACAQTQRHTHEPTHAPQWQLQHTHARTQTRVHSATRAREKRRAARHACTHAHPRTPRLTHTHIQTHTRARTRTRTVNACP